jgi:hypothetical protein
MNKILLKNYTLLSNDEHSELLKIRNSAEVVNNSLSKT